MPFSQINEVIQILKSVHPSMVTKQDIASTFRHHFNLLNPFSSKDKEDFNRLRSDLKLVIKASNQHPLNETEQKRIAQLDKKELFKKIENLTEKELTLLLKHDEIDGLLIYDLMVAGGVAQFASYRSAMLKVHENSLSYKNPYWDREKLFSVLCGAFKLSQRNYSEWIGETSSESVVLTDSLSSQSENPYPEKSQIINALYIAIANLIAFSAWAMNQQNSVTIFNPDHKLPMNMFDQNSSTLLYSPGKNWRNQVEIAPGKNVSYITNYELTKLYPKGYSLENEQEFVQKQLQDLIQTITNSKSHYHQQKKTALHHWEGITVGNTQIGGSTTMNTFNQAHKAVENAQAVYKTAIEKPRAASNSASPHS